MRFDHPNPGDPINAGDQLKAVPPLGYAGSGRVAPRSSQPGFTLLEVLVALVVLSVTLMSIYQSFGAAIHINQATKGLWQAMVFAGNELAKIERGPIPQVSIQQGEYPPDHPMAGYRWKREVGDKEPFPGVKVRKVTFELTWRLGRAKQSYEAQAYVPTN